LVVGNGNSWRAIWGVVIGDGDLNFMEWACLDKIEDAKKLPGDVLSLGSPVKTRDFLS
jgi:hypothetical protein